MAKHTAGGAGPRPLYGNAGLFGRRYGTPTPRTPTADEQANSMRPDRVRDRPTRKGRRGSRR